MPDNVMIIAVVAIVFGSICKMLKILLDRPRRHPFTPPPAEPTVTDQDVRDLVSIASRMQSRIDSLERLLDASQPEWRGKP